METKKRDVVPTVLAARRVSTPLIAIETSDQLALAPRVFEAVNGDAPKFTWDLIRGIAAVGEKAATFLAEIGEDRVLATERDPIELLKLAMEMKPKSLVVMYNAQMFLDSPPVKQAVANLRDPFCGDKRTLLMLGTSFQMPAELGDVMLLDDPLPNDDELGGILTRLYKDTLEREPEPELLKGAVDAGRGLSAFNAEQVYAMSLTKEGLDVEASWERKRAQVNKTKGLKFVRGGPTFDDLGGLDSFKGYIERYMAGPKRPGCIVFLDEVEKATAGAASDTSGVSQDFMGTMLAWMENNLHNGLLAVGAPGTGKTAGGMAIGATYGLPTVVLDVGGLKGQYVGNSEQALRDALKIIDSIAGDAGAFIFATCNKETALPPEFKRRFRAGEWFFDLPTAEERREIWRIQMSRYGLDASAVGEPLMDDEWTGAEIRNSCDTAYSLRCTLKEAAQYVVPITKSAPDIVAGLRKAATGRWLATNYAGHYRGPDAEKIATTSAEKPRRSVSLKD
jgi:hypothetical protein